jgi:LmbE family N-acetylglucosaminyl deacetylase
MTTEPTPKSVLAVGAHPDDLEIMCAGTLAKYAKLGIKVSMAVATDGSAGHMLIPPKELAETRHRETERAAKMIGANFHWLGYQDQRLVGDLETRLRFVELIRKTKPDVILTHDPQDYHPDHRTVSRLMFDASFGSGLPNVKTETPFHPGIQPLYYFDSAMSANFQPTEYVDITETFQIKRQMLSCHVTQIEWIKDHDNVDLINMMETISRSRGFQCGVMFGEAFRIEPVWPRYRAYRMLP